MSDTDLTSTPTVAENAYPTPTDKMSIAQYLAAMRTNLIGIKKHRRGVKGAFGKNSKHNHVRGWKRPKRT